MFIVLKYFFK